MRINEIEKQMISLLMDWKNYMGNYRGIRHDLVFTWDKRVSRMLDHPIMASDVTSLADDGQYTFQLYEDGSIIQLYYAFERDATTLHSARLAYYSARVDESVVRAFSRFTSLNSLFQEEKTDKYMQSLVTGSFESVNEREEFEIFEDVLLKKEPLPFYDGPVVWLRIDYEPETSKGILHHSCHMHFSAFPTARFVVAGVPNPKQFIEFVMASCYPQIYSKHRLDHMGKYANASRIAKVNASCFPLQRNTVFEQLAHFRMPGL